MSWSVGRCVALKGEQEGKGFGCKASDNCKNQDTQIGSAPSGREQNATDRAVNLKGDVGQGETKTQWLALCSTCSNYHVMPHVITMLSHDMFQLRRTCGEGRLLSLAPMVAIGSQWSSWGAHKKSIDDIQHTHTHTRHTRHTHYKNLRIGVFVDHNQQCVCVHPRVP